MIKGLEPQLAEAGKIKIGSLGEKRLKNKAKNKPKDQLTDHDYWRPPIKLDHFVITKTTRRDGKLTVDLAAMDACPKGPGGKVTEIPIVLHSDEIEDVFKTNYAAYAGRKLACTGDGEAATQYAFKDGKRLDQTKSVKCPCKHLDAGNCKPHGTLNCSLMLENNAVAGAVHKWRTTSIISIKRMMGSIIQILATIGTIKGLPLWLKLEPVDTDKGRVYCCHLELRSGDITGLQRAAIESAQMRAALSPGNTQLLQGYRAMITADEETDEEQAAVAQEFHGDPEPEVLDTRPPPLPETKTIKNGTGSTTVEAKTGEVVSETNKKLKNLVQNQPKTETTAREQKDKAEAEKKPDEPPPPTDDDNPDFGGPEK
jgi:hypothetical protein